MTRSSSSKRYSRYLSRILAADDFITLATGLAAALFVNFNFFNASATFLPRTASAISRNFRADFLKCFCTALPSILSSFITKFYVVEVQHVLPDVRGKFALVQIRQVYVQPYFQ